MTTTKDIARELGISHSTVSRVLSGNARVPIAPRTRARVLEAAQRLGYRPNALARSLKNGRTGIVGLYSGFGTFNPRIQFFAEVQLGLQIAGAQLGLDLLLHRAHHSAEEGAGAGSQQLLLELHDGRVDGFFVFTTENDPLLQQLRDSHLPVVSVAEPLADVPSVVANDRAGMQTLVEHLLQKGHRKLLFLTTPRPFASVRRRRQSFEQTLHNADIDASDVWQLEAADAIEAWRALPASKRPTAICCWNDSTAYNLLRAANSAGLRAPDDFAVTGFDGFPDPNLNATQRVTSVACDWHRAGQTAMQLLHQAIGGAPIALETVLPTELAKGDTT